MVQEYVFTFQLPIHSWSNIHQHAVKGKMISSYPLYFIGLKYNETITFKEDYLEQFLTVSGGKFDWREITNASKMSQKKVMSLDEWSPNSKVFSLSWMFRRISAVLMCTAEIKFRPYSNLVLFF